MWQKKFNPSKQHLDEDEFIDHEAYSLMNKEKYYRRD